MLWSAIGVLLGIAVFAGKLGTFHKVPWLVYILQLMVVFQAMRRGSKSMRIGRILIFPWSSFAGFCGALVIGAIIARYLSLILSALLRGSIVLRSQQRGDLSDLLCVSALPAAYLGNEYRLVHLFFGSGDLVSAHTQVANFFGADGATFDSFFIGDAWVDFSYGGLSSCPLSWASW